MEMEQACSASLGQVLGTETEVVNVVKCTGSWVNNVA